jgi:hypothetical protein
MLHGNKAEGGNALATTIIFAFTLEECARVTA